jgi:Putative prokaryotic signal transducing protein
MTEQEADQERRRLAEVYAAMADGELQLLAQDFASLSAEGQDALQSEFQRRDLTPEVDLNATGPGEDVLEWDDLVVLQQFRDLPEALLAKGSLESSGIDVVLVDDNMVRMDWFISNLVGGIKLCVRRQDEAAALELLAEPIPASIDVEGVGSFNQPVCPQCNSLDITLEALNRPVAYLPT